MRPCITIHGTYAGFQVENKTDKMVQFTQKKGEDMYTLDVNDPINIDLLSCD